MRLSIVRVRDLLVYMGLPAIFGMCMVGAAMSNEIHAGLRIVGWNLYTFGCVICALVLYRRLYLVDVFRYRTFHKILVGWTKDKYYVPQAEIERCVEETLCKLEVEFAGARTAVAGCVILFREPLWYSLATMRTVSGEQDGLLISVGWRWRIEHTALAHEIAHRVLQVCANDPEELESHRILDRFQL